MRRISISILTATLLTSSLAFAGGITGGGGNTSPSKRVTIKDVRGALADARLASLGYYLSKYPFRRFPQRWTQEQNRLFAGKRSIDQVIHEVGITIETDRPCYYVPGHPVDASTEGRKPNTICVSAARLARKLNKDNLYSQTVALVAHEYSHLVGFDEHEAEQFQNQLLSEIDGNSSTARLNEVTSILTEVEQSAQEILTRLNDISWDSALSLMRPWDRAIGQIRILSESGPFTFFDAKQEGALSSYTTVVIGTMFSTTANSSDPNERKSFEELTGMLFGDKEVIHLKDLGAANQDDDNRYILDLTVQRVRTKEILATELNEVIKGLRDYRRYLYKLSDDLKIPAY